ncbi:hypothetical protein HLB35_16135 [Halomonas sp. TBZ9]|uniref:Transferrin-binding protein B C-lobe/N-lobe beta-barrel domain-containing protein n=1 Tax=Vreelandella azerica TaxID=2732867 RepID=A0A7Y3TZ89_9GAMM|nr:transferrin-binding protein-like solute binding protein [Halomonas azerica]NOG32918.1 hypothetical protein [Halomonas azerica]
MQDPDSGVDTILSGAGIAFRDGPSNRSDGLTTYLSLSSLRPSVSTLIPSGDLRYAAYGYWSVLDEGNNVTSDQDISIGFAAGGYPTQDGDMPTTGSASFLGAASGLSIASTGKIQDIIGSAEMNVDFARGALSGTMTNMKTGDNVDGAATPWNDIGFNGTLNGNTFTANARVTAHPNDLIVGARYSETNLLGRDAVGSVNGRFYGPQASEAAGTWSLQDSDGNTAVGGFGVKQ